MGQGKMRRLVRKRRQSYPTWHGPVQPKDWYNHRSKVHKAWMVRSLRKWLAKHQKISDTAAMTDLEVIACAQSIVDQNNAAAHRF